MPVQNVIVEIAKKVTAPVRNVNVINVVAAKSKIKVGFSNLGCFLNMETQAVWSQYYSEMYFFILKKVNNKTIADDILQNAFLKIHRSLSQLKDHSKIRAWVFQIVRNELANYFNSEIDYVEQTDNQ